MQLNNNNTGEVVIINNILENSIIVNHYENSYFANITREYKKNISIGQSFNKEVLFPIDILKSMAENELILAYNLLSVLPEFNGYVVSNDSQNWKSDMLDKPIRIIIPNSLVLDSLQLQNELGQLLLALLVQLKDRVVKTEHATSVYIISFDTPEQEALLRSYYEIIIENKL